MLGWLMTAFVVGLMLLDAGLFCCARGLPWVVADMLFRWGILML
jgi:hypothetical protein